jgi:hypothetical protein
MRAACRSHLILRYLMSLQINYKERANTEVAEFPFSKYINFSCINDDIQVKNLVACEIYSPSPKLS